MLLAKLIERATALSCQQDKLVFSEGYVEWSYLKAKQGFKVEFFRSVCPVFMHDLISFQSMIT